MPKSIIVSGVRFRVGDVIKFHYPAHNFHGIRSGFEQRTIEVTEIRDTIRNRLSIEEINLNPTLRRSRYLITGDDIDRNCERSFYDQSMTSLEVTSRKTKSFFVVDSGDIQFAIDNRDAAIQFASGRGNRHDLKTIVGELVTG